MIFSSYLDAHDLTNLLAPREAYRPFPRRQDRAAWAALHKDKRDALLDWGREALSGYPMLTATQFLAFVRTGSREAYETPYFARRVKLMGAALAACVSDGEPEADAFVDAVIDGLWCICEESTWVLSAHNGSSHRGVPPAGKRPLPDVTNPYVDLFAAQTAATLADTLYLLEDRLDAVSPLLARRVRAQIERRVLHPFMTHDDFWWMGMIRRDVNNWTPWILSNVIDTALLLVEDRIRRAEIVSRALRMLDSYLAVMPPDGGCDEGAGYFNMAGAALLDCLESVYRATDGKVSFYGEPHIRAIGAFPLRAHIAGPYFLNFADCDAMPHMDGERIHRYGVRTDNAPLASLGAWLTAQNGGVKPLDTPQMNRVLFTLFAELPEDVAAPAHEAYECLPDLQVHMWRRGGLFAAVKGGHNGENHNHNDVGSFIVYADGEPEIVDMGNQTYTAVTFSDLRYTQENTRARNHNVPMIGECEQAAGSEYAARAVQADADGAQMDIAGAYPKEAGVRALVRELRVNEDGLRLTDAAELDAPQTMTWVFMLRNRPSLAPGAARFGRLTLAFDPALHAGVQEMPVTDARMARNFPGSLWRLTLRADAACAHTQHFTITRS